MLPPFITLRLRRSPRCAYSRSGARAWAPRSDLHRCRRTSSSAPRLLAKPALTLACAAGTHRW